MDKQERKQLSLSKLDSFLQYEAGWDLGRGDKVSPTSIENARLLIEKTFENGVWKSSVFPSPSGAVLVAFPVSKVIDIEVVAETDGTFDLYYEGPNGQKETRANLNLDAACGLVNLFADPHLRIACLSESLITETTSIQIVNVSGVPLSSRQVMEDYQGFFATVRSLILGPSVSTSQNITAESQVIQSCIGSSQHSQTTPTWFRSKTIPIPTPTPIHAM